MIFTIESDDEVELEIENETDTEDFENFSKQSSKSKKVSRKKKAPEAPKSEFVFEFDDGSFDTGKKSIPAASRTDDEDDDEDSEEDDGPDDNVRRMPRADERALRAEVKMTAKEKRKGEEHAQAKDMNAEEEEAFFETVVNETSDQRDVMFSQLSLSRSLLRGIEAAGYVTPTPIQTQVIPLALAGRGK